MVCSRNTWILMVGLPHAGKTTALYRLKENRLVQTIPTIGYNIEDIPRPVFGIKLRIMDACGGDKLRPLIRKHYVEIAPDGYRPGGIIFVIDGANVDEIDEAREYLHSFLSMPELSDTPILLLANKQDLSNAMSVDQVKDLMKLDDSSMTSHPVLIHGTIATTGEGLWEAAREMGRVLRSRVKTPCLCSGHFLSRLLTVPQRTWRVLSAMVQCSVKYPRVLMMGLDGAGKTTCLYKMKNIEATVMTPTIGFNVETVRFEWKSPITIWDIGGVEKLRPLWAHYLPDTTGLIYIVDSADRARFNEARDELEKVIRSPALPHGIPVLVMANKQDKPESCDLSALEIELDLRRILHDNTWHIVATSVEKVEEIHSELKQFTKMIKNSKGTKK